MAENKNINTNDTKGDVKAHIARLGMSLSAYESWCWDHGFRCDTEKTKSELDQEMAFFNREQLRIARIEEISSNPRQLIIDACANRCNPHDCSGTDWVSFCASIVHSPAGEQDRKSLQTLLLYVHDRADFLFEKTEVDGKILPYLDALILLNQQRDRWQRPLEFWLPAKLSCRRQFATLLRHLLARYPVPTFMDSAWLESVCYSDKHREWYLLIAHGHSIQEADTPFPLTSRMAHHFMQVPDCYTIPQALRWAEIHGLGGDRWLTEAVLSTRIGVDFRHYRFWRDVIEIFIDNPLFDRRYVGPVVDYLIYQKFETKKVILPSGDIERRPPPNPDLHMRDLPARELLRQVLAWHKNLERNPSSHGLYFPASDYAPFTLHRDDEVWRIRQLLTSLELVKDGKALNHCIATYAESCLRGHCSIWSLTCERDQIEEKQLTIEVKYHGRITQIRGRDNRLPSADEFDIIRQWARANDISFNPGVEQTP